jgi:protein TonB
MGRKEHVMFLESLVEYTPQVKARRRWATVVSFAIEVLCVGVVIAFPLIYNEALPALQAAATELLAPPMAAGPVGPTTEVERPRGPRTQSEVTADGGVRLPVRIPDHTYIPKEPEQALPTGGGAGPYIPGSILGTGNDRGRTVTELLDTRTIGVAKPTEAATTRQVLTSQFVEGLLIRRVQPAYPHLAVIAHTQGQVVLHAVIGRGGTIQGLQVVSGHPQLVQAAVDAVKQWRYRPYVLNGRPIEIETQVYVNFVLR